MKFEQKITEAKTRQRNRIILAAIGLVAVLMFSILVFVFVSPDQFRNDIASEPSATSVKPEIKLVDDGQLRQQYLDAFREYENTLKPELDKIDLPVWNKARSEQLSLLKNKALSEFASGDYANAANTIEEFRQLAQTTITESQKAFQQALSNALKAYQTDQYDEAKLQITQALMLDKASDAAIRLAAKIDKMPEIIHLLEQINTAHVENKPRKELKLVRELLRIAPDRASAVKRRQTLVNSIRQSNFNTAIAQSYQALKRGDIQTARQNIKSTKKIFPQRQEIADVRMALQKLVKKQRLERYRRAIEQAIAADDWLTVKQQAARALQEHSHDKTTQESLKNAIAIVALTNTFEETLQHPYRLSNQHLVSKLNTSLAEVNAFSDLSPSLGSQAEKLSRLIKQVNTKIQVEVTSDNQTTILVRGVGKIGKTQLKTLHLLPGHYTFEGKRKGFKSRLVKVLIPYDTNSFHIDIRCDEPI